MDLVGSSGMSQIRDTWPVSSNYVSSPTGTPSPLKVPLETNKFYPLPITKTWNRINIEKIYRHSWILNTSFLIAHCTCTTLVHITEHLKNGHVLWGKRTFLIGPPQCSLDHIIVPKYRSNLTWIKTRNNSILNVPMVPSGSPTQRSMSNWWNLVTQSN